MTGDLDKWQIVTVTASETEGALIVAALESQDIEAYLEGGMTASFRAEAPGQARVLVREQDMAGATEIVGEFRHEPTVCEHAWTPKQLGWSVATMLLIVVLVLTLIYINA